MLRRTARHVGEPNQRYWKVGPRSLSNAAPAANADGTSKSGRTRPQKHTCSMSNVSTVAITVAEPADIGGIHGRFEPELPRKTLTMDADGNSGRRALELRT